MIRPALFIGLMLAMLLPWAGGATALAAGALFALTLGNPFPAATRRWTPRLLQASVVGLGAGMNLEAVGRVGAQGLLYTAVGITATLALSRLLAAALGTDRQISALLGVGTAICGGSAIAAVSPVIRARDESVSVSLATVFLLNAVALLIFPAIGQWSGMDERQFGLFSALAIHDTSSVVGSALRYGPEALAVATPVKLARALWIVPVALGFALLGRGGGRPRLARAPWFILGFLAAAALVTWVPELAEPGRAAARAARQGLVLTLFLIGAGLTRATLRSVGTRPFAHGVLLWLAAIVGTWGAIRAGWIG
jgi:uncharacterized integral membrane protein (TIGR00698 family)